MSYEELRRKTAEECATSKEVGRMPKHLSPSSLSTWKKCPYSFYLKKMAPDKPAPEPTSRATIAGTGFDAHVKAWINQYQKLAKLDVGQAKLITDPMDYIKDAIDDEDLRIESNIVGRKLLGIYIGTAGADLLQKTPIMTELDTTTVLGTTGIPVNTKIDAVLSDGQILDWKVRGYASSAKSPTQGWLCKWQKGKLYTQPHDKVDWPFELINESWAKQLAIYNFARGHTPGQPLIGLIDELSMRNVEIPDDISPDTVTVTRLRLRIGEEFQIKVMKELETVWAMITEENIPTPSPCYGTCYAYRKLCSVASVCGPYKRMESAVQMQADLAHSKYTPMSNYDKILDAMGIPPSEPV